MQNNCCYNKIQRDTINHPQLIPQTEKTSTLFSTRLRGATSGGENGQDKRTHSHRCRTMQRLRDVHCGMPL